MFKYFKLKVGHPIMKAHQNTISDDRKHEQNMEDMASAQFLLQQEALQKTIYLTLVSVLIAIIVGIAAIYTATHSRSIVVVPAPTVYVQTSK